MLISLQKEYQSHFMFTDYGFKSMRDMAYKLPSVFYVKMVEERDECILYSTCRRVELESDVNGWCKFMGDACYLCLFINIICSRF